jgi:hypothetical protein
MKREVSMLSSVFVYAMHMTNLNNGTCNVRAIISDTETCLPIPTFCLASILDVSATPVCRYSRRLTSNKLRMSNQVAYITQFWRKSIYETGLRYYTVIRHINIVVESSTLRYEVSLQFIQ